MFVENARELCTDGFLQSLINPIERRRTIFELIISLSSQIQ